jgi:hypothetical protein
MIVINKTIKNENNALGRKNYQGDYDFEQANNDFLSKKIMILMILSEKIVILKILFKS